MPRLQVDVVGVGLNATDTLLFLSDFPVRESKVPLQGLSVRPGGQVATAMIACQNWGLQTCYVGKLGDDQAAALHRKEFEQTGVEARIVTVPNCPSAQSFILVDGHGERTVLWGRDPRLTLQPEELDREWIVNARALLVDGCDTEAAIMAASWARAAGIPVIADLDDTYSGVEKLLSTVDSAVVSRTFPKQLLSKSDLRESLPLMHERFGCRVVAATLGRDGVLAWDGSRLHHACAYQVSVVDTTGAGDLFHAAFIYGLLQNWSLQQQLDFACGAAALNCTAPGARGYIASRAEIEQLIATGSRYSPFAVDGPLEHLPP